MDLEARVIQFLGETSGTSKAGNPWKKKEWVVETFGNYPRKVKIQCFGDRADTINLEQGRDYVFSVDLESREFNGRWYTDVSVYRVADYVGGQQMGPQPGYGGSQPVYGAPQPGYQGGYPQGGQQAYAPHPPYGDPAAQPFAPQNDAEDEELPF